MLTSEKTLTVVNMSEMTSATVRGTLPRSKTPKYASLDWTDVMILKIFSPKNCERIAVFGLKHC
jgi:hypothetical protein